MTKINWKSKITIELVKGTSLNYILTVKNEFKFLIPQD